MDNKSIDVEKIEAEIKEAHYVIETEKDKDYNSKNLNSFKIKFLKSLFS